MSEIVGMFPEPGAQVRGVAKAVAVCRLVV
jgi:hypothetical protein